MIGEVQVRNRRRLRASEPHMLLRYLPQTLANEVAQTEVTSSGQVDSRLIESKGPPQLSLEVMDIPRPVDRV